MNDLDVGEEPESKVTDRPRGQIDGVLAQDLCSDLLELPALHEAGDADVRHEVVGDVAGGGDQPG